MFFHRGNWFFYRMIIGIQTQKVECYLKTQNLSLSAIMQVIIYIIFLQIKPPPYAAICPLSLTIPLYLVFFFFTAFYLSIFYICICLPST